MSDARTESEPGVLAGVARTLPPPRGSSRPSPLDAPPVERRSAAIVAGTGAIVVHVGFVALATVVGAGVVHQTAPALISEFVEVELPTPVPPPPAEIEPPKPSPVVKAPAARAPEPVREAPPPAAAQAAEVLAAAEEVVDFGDAFVAGAGTTYAGGVTESGGTSQTAVRDTRARAGGVKGGTGAALRGDLSRPPALAGGATWDCPFPEEADDVGVDRAVVTLRVDVGADGSVSSASVTRDPGNGFGREARRCALRKRWSPGLDRAGLAIDASAVVNVRFER